MDTTNTANEMTCKCWDNGCNPRILRGLKPLCCMTAADLPKPATTADGTFSTIQEAYAAYPGKRVKLLSGGNGTGSAPRFGLAFHQ